jgi:hypothetical protein
MPVIPFVGQTYQMEARTFDSQRCVNLYPILSESGTSKSVAALRSTSGLELFASVGGGAIRGGIESQQRAFFVSGDEFYELDNEGNETMHGTLDTATGVIDIAENPTQVMITDGSYGYIFTKATDTFAKITDIDFPVPSDLTFQDGYFIVTEKDTGKFWISSLNDGLTWDALDFTTVESSPDNLVGLISDSSNLWLFGTKTTEVFQNTGNATFPFQRISGAIIETGCAAQETIQEIDNAVFWLGSDENGDSILWRSNGYNATRASTMPIERKIAESVNVNESYSWVYHERGHAFYVLQLKGVDTTLVLDVATGLWHERSWRNNTTGEDKQHRGSCHIFFKQKHLVGDRENSNVYRMSLDIYSDNGDEIVRERISPYIAQDKALITHAQLELDMETGVGLQSGQGSNPMVMMQYSDDGARTWSNEIWREMGKIGEYRTRVKWNKLGASRDRVYRVRYSEPTFFQINEAILNGS